MTDSVNIINLLALFGYLAVFGCLFKLFLFRAVRYALASGANGFSGEQVFAAGNRTNLLLTFLSFVLILLPLVVLIAVPDALPLLLGS